jgi:hypothetical protein
MFAVAFATGKSGGCPAGKFFDALDLLDKAKLVALFRLAGDRGQFHNPEKFGDWGGGLFEFKSFQIRMPFAYAKNERGVIVVTHGFFKKKPRTPQEEIARAWRIYEEDGARAKLAIVRKHDQGK